MGQDVGVGHAGVGRQGRGWGDKSMSALAWPSPCHVGKGASPEHMSRRRSAIPPPLVCRPAARPILV